MTAAKPPKKTTPAHKVGARLAKGPSLVEGLELVRGQRSAIEGAIPTKHRLEDRVTVLEDIVSTMMKVATSEQRAAIKEAVRQLDMTKQQRYFADDILGD